MTPALQPWSLCIDDKVRRHLGGMFQIINDWIPTDLELAAWCRWMCRHGNRKLDEEVQRVMGGAPRPLPRGA